MNQATIACCWLGKGLWRTELYWVVNNHNKYYYNWQSKYVTVNNTITLLGSRMGQFGTGGLRPYMILHKVCFRIPVTTFYLERHPCICMSVCLSVTVGWVSEFQMNSIPISGRALFFFTLVQTKMCVGLRICTDSLPILWEIKKWTSRPHLWMDFPELKEILNDPPYCSALQAQCACYHRADHYMSDCVLILRILSMS